MYQFKKTDSNELRWVMLILMCLLMVWTSVSYLEYALPVQHDASAYIANATYYGFLFLGFWLMLALIKYLTLKENRKFGILELLIIIRIFTLLLSTVFADRISVAFFGNTATCEGFVIECMYLGLFYTTALLNQTKCHKWVCIFMVVVVLIQVVSSILQSNFFVTVGISSKEAFMDMFDGRAYGTMYNPNPLGQYLAIASTVFIVLFLFSDSVKHNVRYTALSVLSLYALLLTGTRAGYLGIFVSAIFFLLVLFFILRNKWDFNKKIWIKLILIFGICCIGLVFLSIFTSVFKSIIERSRNDLTSGILSSMGSGRMEIWKDAFNIFQSSAKNMIIGQGTANFKHIHLDFINTSEGTMVEPAMTMMVHNFYLEILTNQGILGLISYLLVIGYVIYVLCSRIAKEKNVGALALLFGIITYLISDIFSWHLLPMACYIYIFLGLGIDRAQMKSLRKKR